MRTGTKVLLGILTIGGVGYAVYRATTAEGKGAPVSVEFASPTSFHLGTSHTPVLDVTNKQDVELPLSVSLVIDDIVNAAKSCNIGGKTTKTLTFPDFSTSLDPANFGDYSVKCTVTNADTLDVYLDKQIATVTVSGIRSADWDPSIYDFNGNGKIDDEELKEAHKDYLAGYISDSQIDDVEKAWSSGLESPVGVELSWK